jgi:hypothetical protein
MTLTDFKVGDLITVTKPRNLHEGPTWNDSSNMTNMNYLTEGTHEIQSIGTYIYVYDERIQQCWSLDIRWCTLANNIDVNRNSPYYNIIRKSKQLNERFVNRKKGTEYAF